MCRDFTYIHIKHRSSIISFKCRYLIWIKLVLCTFWVLSNGSISEISARQSMILFGFWHTVSSVISYDILKRLCGDVIKVFRMLILTWISGRLLLLFWKRFLFQSKKVAGNCQGSPRFHHVHDHVDNRHVHELASWNPPINAHFSALTILCC